MCNNGNSVVLLWVLCRGQACLLSMCAVRGSHVADSWCTSDLRHTDILSVMSPWIVKAGTVLCICSPQSSTGAPLAVAHMYWNTHWPMCIISAKMHHCLIKYEINSCQIKLVCKSLCYSLHMTNLAVENRNPHMKTHWQSPQHTNTYLLCSVLHSRNGICLHA